MRFTVTAGCSLTRLCTILWPQLKFGFCLHRTLRRGRETQRETRSNTYWWASFACLLTLSMGQGRINPHKRNRGAARTYPFNSCLTKPKCNLTKKDLEDFIIEPRNPSQINCHCDENSEFREKSRELEGWECRLSGRNPLWRCQCRGRYSMSNTTFSGVFFFP